MTIVTLASAVVLGFSLSGKSIQTIAYADTVTGDGSFNCAQCEPEYQACLDSWARDRAKKYTAGCHNDFERCLQLVKQEGIVCISSRDICKQNCRSPN